MHALGLFAPTKNTVGVLVAAIAAVGFVYLIFLFNEGQACTSACCSLFGMGFALTAAWLLWSNAPGPPTLHVALVCVGALLGPALAAVSSGSYRSYSAFLRRLLWEYLPVVALFGGMLLFLLGYPLLAFLLAFGLLILLVYSGLLSSSTIFVSLG